MPPCVLYLHRAGSFVTRQLQPGVLLVEAPGPPKFLGSLIGPFAHVHATPAGRTFLTRFETSMLPPLVQRRRLQQQYFRGSVAWLPDSLSTLRSAGYPDTTQDSLPAAGQALPGGTCTHKGSYERFLSASFSQSSSFPKLLGAMNGYIGQKKPLSIAMESGLLSCVNWVTVLAERREPSGGAKPEVVRPAITLRFNHVFHE